MRRTGFHLRAIKCPGCGAQVPYAGGATEVRCEYCQQISAVVRGAIPKPPGPNAPSRPAPVPYPQVTPTVRPAIIMALVGGLFAVGISAGSFLLSSSAQAPSSLATPAASMQPSAAYVFDVEGAADTQAAASGEAELVSVAGAESIHPDPDAGARQDEQEAKPKSKRKPKPKPKPKPSQSDGYAIARILKPALSGCAPRDIFAPGQPLRYTPTIVTTLVGGSFHDTSVSIKLSSTDLSKIYFPDDRKRPVTQADLDERQSRVASCIKKGVESTKMPADAPQREVEGRLSITFSHDGVPYGIKTFK